MPRRWIKVDVALSTHWRVLAGDVSSEALMVAILLWSKAKECGSVDVTLIYNAKAISRMGRWSHPEDIPTWLDELLASGLFIRDPSGNITIRDWEQHQVDPTNLQRQTKYRDKSRVKSTIASIELSQPFERIMSPGLPTLGDEYCHNLGDKVIIACNSTVTDATGELHSEPFCEPSKTTDHVDESANVDADVTRKLQICDEKDIDSNYLEEFHSEEGVTVCNALSRSVTVSNARSNESNGRRERERVRVREQTNTYVDACQNGKTLELSLAPGDPPSVAAPSVARRSEVASSVQQAYDAWREYHPKAPKHLRCGSKGYRRAMDRLAEGADTALLVAAVHGCHRSAFHRGDNDACREYLSLDLIWRDMDHVVKFAEMAENRAVVDHRDVSRHNARVAAAWLSEDN